MTLRRALALLKQHGVMLEAARGPVPNLVDEIAGERLRGSWWTHPRAREMFEVTRAVRDSPHVLVTRLVNGRITYVHRRLWPALVRVAPRLQKTSIARLREVHTQTGAHRIEVAAFPNWVPDDVRQQAAALTQDAAIRLLGEKLVPFLSWRAGRKTKRS
jgi:hypothetical protein